MKRSEAIKIMVEEYSKYPPFMGKEEKMTHVLKALEDLGVVQPVYQDEVGTGQLDDEGYEISTVAWVQGWEPENDNQENYGSDGSGGW